MAQSLRELEAKRDQVVANMRTLVARADAAQREMTASENARWGKWDAITEDLRDQIIVARANQRRAVKR